MLIFSVSDIHLDQRETFEEILATFPPADLLIIPGDIGSPYNPLYEKFLRACRGIYQHVLVIAGNHEYYNSHDIDETTNHLRMINFRTGCIFLQKDFVEIDGIIFLGCTLWARIKNEEIPIALNQLRELKTVRRDGKLISLEQYHQMHTDHLNWLIGKLRDFQNENVVVITHHCPTYQLNDPAYAGYNLSSAFFNHLDRLINYPIVLWFCGHSHKAKTIKIGPTTVRLNPIGHQNETSNWSTMRITL